MKDQVVDGGLSEAIAEFERDNKELVETIRLFHISNAEYEKALSALLVSPVRTTASTHEGEHALLG